MSSDLLRAALETAEHGHRVLPVLRGGKAPAGRLVHHGLKDAMTDPAQIRRWWAAEPRANVGIACGHDLGDGRVLAVLDVDPRDGGDVTLDATLAALGVRLPATPEVATGGGGSHFYFAAPAGTRSMRLGAGLDLKASGGYVVSPPSLHESGHTYAWQGGRHLFDLSLAALPCWIVDRERAVRRFVGDEHREDESDDVLLTIPAVEYVRELTGREPEARGFVRCPFHKGGEERTPSLRLYERSWYCFACHTGGSIYTLAALLGGYRLPLRGARFLTVQSTLLEHFGARAVAS